MRGEDGQATCWRQITKICKNQKPQTCTSNDSKARNIYVKELHGFLCVSETLKSLAVDVDLVQEGDLEIEEGDKKGTFQGSFVVHERRISRHHEEAQTKLCMSISLRSVQGDQDSISFEGRFFKLHVGEWKTHKNTKDQQPGSVVLKRGHNFQKNKEQKEIAEGAEETAKLHHSTQQQGIYKKPAKVIADPRSCDAVHCCMRR